MTIAVAHQPGPASDAVLRAAVREAASHGEDLVILNIQTAVDLDTEETQRQGIANQVDAVLEASDATGVGYTVHTTAASTSGVDDVAGGILRATTLAGASLLVIGARRRSPVGKAFLGSVTQEVLLDSPVPVLVVKAPA